MGLLDFFKFIFFDKHEYEIGSEKYIQVKKLAHFYSYKNVYFSMYYNDYYRDMIYELKYRRKKYVAGVIYSIIKDFFEHVIEINNIEYIICVPISSKRRRKRGFNQVEEIFNDKKDKFLKIRKIKDTKKMSKLSENYKKSLNIKNSFDVSNLNLDNKTILIVDDIITTGATVKEIENAIKREYKNVTVYIYAVAVSKKLKKF